MSSHKSTLNPISAEVAGEKVDKTVGDYSEYFASSDEALTRRKAEYATVTNHFYDLVTDFYEYGWGPSFHFAPRCHSESFVESLKRHEHYLGMKLNLKKGQTCLDLGCGVGGPALEISRFTGAKLIGINNNDYQIRRCEARNVAEGLTDQCSFKKGDFMKLPFEDNSIDAAYQIEAFVHAPDKAALYAEVFRVLKPGGVFGGYEWIMTDKFDKDNQHHQRVKAGIEIGNGLAPMIHFDECAAFIEGAGFKMADRHFMGENDPMPWYDSLVGNWTTTLGIRRTRQGRAFTHMMVKCLEATRLAPKGTVQVSEILNNGADDLVEGGLLGIFHPAYFVLARKPE